MRVFEDLRMPNNSGLNRQNVFFTEHHGSARPSHGSFIDPAGSVAYLGIVGLQF